MFDKIAFDPEAEKDLIRRAQKGDVLAYKRLRKMYRGVIEDSINKSGVTSDNIPRDILMAESLREFKRSIDTYDLTKGVKPSTWITSNISQDLKKIDRSYKNQARVSDSDTLLMGNVESAIKQLEAEGIEDADPDTIAKTIETNFGKKVDGVQIGDIMSRRRKEMSLNKGIGEDGVGENLEVQDVMNVPDTSMSDIIKEDKSKDDLDSLLSKLNDDDRRIFEKAKGIGSFKGAGPMKVNDIAKDENLKSEYFVKTKLKSIEDQLKDLKID